MSDAPKSCIALVSGGLDSLLAVRVMVNMGIRVVAYHGTTVFHCKIVSEAETRAQCDELEKKLLGLGASEVVFRDQSRKMIDLTNNPRYGYGKNLNACIDCRIMTITSAKQLMDERGADFLISGEVLGQRPKSQTLTSMAIVDKAVKALGIGGLLLRPLSAKLLEPTVPELQGWVDREALFDFNGRDRNGQMALAEQLGIGEYPNPGGGCLLTDPGFCGRLKDLIGHNPAWDVEDVRLLKVGRLFRIGDRAVVIASRCEAENKLLLGMEREGDRLFITAAKPGALILLRGEIMDETCRVAAGLAVHYSKHREDGRAEVRCDGLRGTGTLGAFDRVDPSQAGYMFHG